MTRHLILGNGNLLVCIDKDARIRDFYYPYVGQENHVSGNKHFTGIFVDGKFSWISRDTWDLSIKYKKDTLVSDIEAYNKDLKVRLLINEAVHFEKSIFLRQVVVKNESDSDRKIKIFFNTRFHISEANIGDTVYYNPILKSIVNYKGKRYFLIGGLCDGESFDDYATGVAGEEGMLGSYVDAEDGVLSKNAIEHGSVDSTIAFTLDIKKQNEKVVDFWIAVGQRYGEISMLKNYIIEKGLSKLILETDEYWSKWVNTKIEDFNFFDEKIFDLFKRSLLIVRAQTDNGGAIIAANDTHTFHFKKDTYSYMWPRDGALIARSLDRVGHHDITEKFFSFCARIVTKEGYLLHKYRPDGSLGSSWHSWLKNNELQLPIQEDETALVLDALWKHYLHTKDDNSIKKYKKFIKITGDFLANFRDKKTGLPKESYDLWEEKLGVHTFTCCTVYAGLMAAKNFANLFGRKIDEKRYEKIARELKEAIQRYLYDDKMGIFIKGISYDRDGNVIKDRTIDISTFYGLFEYGILDIDDERMTRTYEATMQKLWCKAPCGGMFRYENDMYYRKTNLPNPWFISTMWLAEYYIAKAKTLEELNEVKKLFFWVYERAIPSGVFSEQLNPYTKDPMSVAPLTWSHASFIIALLKYLDKQKELNEKLNIGA